MPDIGKFNGVAVASLAKINGRTMAAGDKILGLTWPGGGGGDVGLTADTMQGVFGVFEATLNADVTPSQDNIQGVFGKFGYVIDNSNADT